MTTCELPIQRSHCRTTRKKGLGARLGRILGLMAAWHERSRQRRECRELLAMPDYLLDDMGVAREDLYQEARKPFWKA